MENTSDWAFQIVDDLLDLTSTAEQLGKATGKDAAKGKNTYPSLLGIEASRQEADRQLKLGLGAIKLLEGEAQNAANAGRIRRSP